MIDEETFNASDNEDTPAEPILFSIQHNNVKMIKKQKVYSSRFKKTMCELTFRASDNEDAPESLTLSSTKKKKTI